MFNISAKKQEHKEGLNQEIVYLSATSVKHGKYTVRVIYNLAVAYVNTEFIHLNY